MLWLIWLLLIVLAPTLCGVVVWFQLRRGARPSVEPRAVPGMTRAEPAHQSPAA